MLTTGLIWNTESFLDSIRRLKHYRDIGYDVWVGHEQAEWEANTKNWLIDNGLPLDNRFREDGSSMAFWETESLAPLSFSGERANGK